MLFISYIFPILITWYHESCRSFVVQVLFVVLNLQVIAQRHRIVLFNFTGRISIFRFFFSWQLIKRSFLIVCWSNVLTDNLLIVHSFLTDFWSNVLLWQFIERTFFSDSMLIKRSFLTACWSNVLFWQYVDQTFFSDSDVTLELPFTLSHPKPPEETPPPTPVQQQSTPTEEAAGTILDSPFWRWLKEAQCSYLGLSIISPLLVSLA